MDLYDILITDEADVKKDDDDDKMNDPVIRGKLSFFLSSYFVIRCLLKLP
jgi:hypothetical protein